MLSDSVEASVRSLASQDEAGHPGDGRPDHQRAAGGRPVRRVRPDAARPGPDPRGVHRAAAGHVPPAHRVSPEQDRGDRIPACRVMTGWPRPSRRGSACRSRLAMATRGTSRVHRCGRPRDGDLVAVSASVDRSHILHGWTARIGRMAPLGANASTTGCTTRPA